MARAELPGIGFHEVTPETFAAFTSAVKMIAPPDGRPQVWFSAEAEFTGTVASASPNSLNLVEPVPEDAYGGLRVRITGTSPAAGQIRTIAPHHSSTQLVVTSPFAITPEPGDGAEVYTGELPPGHWGAACSQADPCLDIQGARELMSRGVIWIWFDAGDVWDSDAEWCDAAHRPPGYWQQGGCEGTQNRFMAPASTLENEIVWGLSSTDLTGAKRATIDCDSFLHYPPQGGGVFENQIGSNIPAEDGPAGWLLVQGFETRCWRRPAPGSATNISAWGAGAGIYRQEFSGKILALNNRHGDLWDGSSLVSMNGGNFTQGERYVGGIVLVDVEANTADYSVMAGQCVATNDPYRSCNGTDFSGVGRGVAGGPLQPHLIEAYGGGDVLWVGGAGVIRNKNPGPDPPLGRPIIEAWGFNDFTTNSGVGGSQSITLVNLKVEGGGPAAPQEPVLLIFPSPNRRGTRFDTVIVNSSFREISDSSAVAMFWPTTESNRGTDTSLDMHWMNVSVTGFGGVLKKFASSDSPTAPEIDGGAHWTGRCLLFDGARRSAPGSLLELQSSAESLATRCARNFVDVQGWMDGDDVADQFDLCVLGSSSYASDAMSGPLFAPGNAGQTQDWHIFSQANSGDWGGRGVDLDVEAASPTSPEIWNAVHDTCSDEAVYPLGQTLPIGFLSTASNPISMLRVSGVRDLGYNELAPAPTEVGFWAQQNAALSNPEILDVLRETGAAIYLLLEYKTDYGPGATRTFARDVTREANRRGIPVNAWITVPAQNGIFAHENNAELIQRAVEDLPGWAIEQGLKFREVTLDLEFPIGNQAVFDALSGDPSALEDSMRPNIDPVHQCQAVATYRDTISWAHVRGIPVTGSPAPFFLDDLSDGHIALQDALDGVAFPPLGYDALYLQAYRTYSNAGPGYVAQFYRDMQARFGATGQVSLGDTQQGPPYDVLENLVADVRMLAGMGATRIPIFELGSTADRFGPEGLRAIIQAARQPMTGDELAAASTEQPYDAAHRASFRQLDDAAVAMTNAVTAPPGEPDGPNIYPDGCGDPHAVPLPEPAVDLTWLAAIPLLSWLRRR
jgi:hypothetical protein